MSIVGNPEARPFRAIPSGRTPRGFKATFDEKRTRQNNEDARRLTSILNTQVFGVFRERDRTPAKKVVTAKLMGDPAPDRPRPTDEETERQIPMTFREQAARTQ